MTKEELTNILRMFETGNEYSGTRMMLGSDNLHVGVFKWDYYPGGNYYWQEPEYMESLNDEYSLLEIAKYIDEMPSWYWHSIAADIRDYYYAHIDWKTFSTSKEYLDFMCEHFKDLKCDEAIEISKSIFYAYQQLYKIQEEIKEVNAEIDKGGLEEDEIRQLCNALNQLLGDEDNLKWEIDVLLNK